MSNLRVVLCLQLCAAIFAMFIGTLAGAVSLPYGITAIIRDSSNGTDVFVTTSDYSYAMSTQDPQLLSLNVSLNFFSINEDSVFGVKSLNETFLISYSNLDESVIEAIRLVKSGFNQNLVGLLFTDAKARPTISDYDQVESYQSSAPFDGYQSSYQSNGYQSSYRSGGGSSSSKSYYGSKTGRTSQCAAPYNYFNLDLDDVQVDSQSSSNNRSNDSGVFHFDTSGCPLDIYSESYSVQMKDDALGIFNEDATIFVYTQLNLPYNIIWFLYVKDRVFFVYSDGTVLAKLLTQLDQTELKLVVASRDKIRNLNAYLDRGAASFES